MKKQDKLKLSRAMRLFLCVLIFISLYFFTASYFFNKSTELHFIPIPYLLASIVFWMTQSIATRAKPFVIISTTLLGTIIAFLLIFSTMVLPGSRNHEYVMVEICYPAIAKYYGVKDTSKLPNRALDSGRDGSARWFAQHSECEDNVYKGKGPVFSENPPGFR